MPQISLYAEVLTHIRQLTLHASLETSDIETPRIDISSDKRVITVVHGDESSSLYLPTQISGTANVTFLTPKKTELTARVQIEDLAEWKEFDESGAAAPWDATELSTETKIQCIRCHESVLVPGSISQWKDLPHQDWADIMDLWYCHKPHEHHDSNEQKRAAEVKGYAAQSKLASVHGVGMVDVVSFVLHPNNCQNIQISDRSNKDDLKPRKASCSNCSTVVGSFSPAENLTKMYKSNLAVQRTENSEFQSYPTSIFICAQLLALVDSSPIRKVVVHTTDEARTKKTHLKEEDVTTQTDSRSPSNTSKVHTTQSAQESRQATVEDEPDVRHETPPSTTTTGNYSEDNNNGTKAKTLDGETNSENPAGLLLWIFNPNIYYSSSHHTSTSDINTANSHAHAHRAMKIFYQTLSDPRGYLNTTPETAVEELELPTVSNVHELYDTLVRSTCILPLSARDFQDWRVGLIDRYEKKHTADDVMGENPLARRAEGDGGGKITRWDLPAGCQELYL